MKNFKIKSILRQPFIGVSRGVSAKKNIFLLFIFNGLNFIINIFLVRLTFDYLGQENYGVWITLSSVFSWFGYLDFGLGNGLRNKLAEAFAKNEHHLARIYVSTTYAVFTLAIIILYLLFLIFYKSIEWASFFNTEIMLRNDLSLLVFYAFTFFIINFVLKLITFITAGD